jgi:hypothetical protein
MLLLLLAGSAGAGTFSVGYSPTGIAYDAISNRVCLSSGNQVNTYDTNGALQSSFIPSSGIFDLGGGTGGNVWVGNGTTDRKYDYEGNFIPPSLTIPNTTVFVGRELTIGGTNWVVYGASGGNVVALNLSNGATAVLLATPAGTTGGDWVLRPGGYALDHVLVAVNSVDAVQTFSKDGTNGFQLYQEFALDDTYGAGKDISFGENVVWAAQGPLSVGYAVTYPFVVPAVAEAEVSVGLTNGSAVVSWSGRWLEGSADLASWARLTNAPQPYVPALTNAAQYFRAVK